MVVFPPHTFDCRTSSGNHRDGVLRPYLHTLILLLLDTGLRPNAEALTLKWIDVDVERGMVTVVSSKTPAGLRTVPMTSRLKAELLRWKKLTGPKNSEFVFFYPRNPAKHLLHVRKTWARALKDANRWQPTATVAPHPT